MKPIFDDPHIAVICTLDALGAREQQNVSYYGLTLSVGVKGGDDNQAKAWAPDLKPWTWQVNAIKLLQGSNAGFASPDVQEIKLLDVHSKPLPVDASDYKQLLSSMETRWGKFNENPSRFRWGDPLAEDDADGDDVSKARRPWALFLANASSFPYPYAQWLNLSVHFRVTWKGAPPTSDTNIVAAPELAIAPGIVYSLPNPAPAIPLAPGSGEVVWQYATPAINAPTIVAHCGAAAAQPKKFGRIDGGTLWVTVPKAQTVFGREWRAELGRASADAFDLSQRVIDALRDKIADDAASERRMEPARTLALCAMNDLISYGDVPGPNGAPTLLADFAARVGPGAVRDTLNAIAKANKPASTLEQWKASLREALPAALGPTTHFVSLRSEGDRHAAQNPKEALAELQRIRDALRLPEVVTALLLGRWRALNLGLTPEFEQKIAQLVAEQSTRERLASAAAAPMWDEWTKSSLTMNSASEKQRDSLAKSFGSVLDAAAYERFGFTPRPNEHRMDALRSREPRPSAAAAAAAKDWLESFLSTWATTERDRLIPAADSSTAIKAVDVRKKSRENGPRQRPTPVPHPLAIEVGLVQPFVGDADKTEDRGDALRHFSGFGVMMRQAGDDNAPWRTLNLGVAADITSPPDGNQEPSARLRGNAWGNQALMLPLRIGYYDGVSEATVSYDNRPIAALSPDALMGDHGLKSQGSDTGEEPILRFQYAPKDNFSTFGLDAGWSKLEALAFGRTYQVAMFVAANCGALPVALTDGADTVAKLKHAPPTKVPADAYQTVWYPRRVAIGMPRFTNGPTSRDSHSIAPPSVPENVFPRARELFGTSVVEQGSGGSFLLLRPPFVGTTLPTEYAFNVRRPTTDVQTWLRWQLASKVDGKALSAVVAEYYKRIAYNHDHENAPKPLNLDDPAVSEQVAVLLEYDDAADRWSTVGSVQRWTPKPDAADGVAVDITPPAPSTTSAEKKIRVTSVKAGQPPSFAVATDGSEALIASVVEGRIYRLVVANLVKNVERFDPGCEVGWANDELYKAFGSIDIMSPWTMWIEVATPAWAPANTSDAALRKSIYGKVEVSFVGGEPDATGRITDEGRLQLGVKLTRDEAQYLHHAEVFHQRWFWGGREPYLEKLPRPSAGWRTRFIETLDPKKDADIIAWEASEFGGRNEEGVMTHVMSNTVKQVPATASGRAADGREWAYVLDFAGDRAASYHRFALNVHHRYAAVFNLAPIIAWTSYSNNTTWRWHSFLVPCRPADPPAKPVVRAILPLTARARPADPKAPEPEHTAGVLVLVKDPAFAHGGLAERFRVRTAIAGRPNATLYEFGPDPITRGTGDPVKPPIDALEDVAVRGPVGHSFDNPSQPGVEDGGPRRFTTASFVVPAPKLARDLSGYMMKMQFGRSLDPSLTIPLQPAPETDKGQVLEWSDGHWVQLVADSRLVGQGYDIGSFWLSLDPKTQRIRSMRQGAITTPKLPGSQGPLHTLLAVTRSIRDVTGAQSEAWIGLFREESDGVWVWLGDLDDKGEEVTKLSDIGDFPLYGRFVHVMRGSQSTNLDISKLRESQVWDRIFEPQGAPPANQQWQFDTLVKQGQKGAGVRDRLRIVGITPRIGDRDPIARGGKP